MTVARLFNQLIPSKRKEHNARQALFQYIEDVSETSREGLDLGYVAGLLDQIDDVNVPRALDIPGRSRTGPTLLGAVLDYVDIYYMMKSERPENEEAIVKALVEKGADVNNSGYYEAPVVIAFKHRANLRNLVTLIKAGADLEIDYQNDGVMRAVTGYGQCVVREVRTAQQAAKSDNWPALHRAAWDGDKQAVEKLIAEGADVNERDAHNNMPLHMAALAGHADICQMLLGADANLHAVNDNLRSPAHMAALMAEEETLSVLAKAGALLGQPDARGFTAVQHYTHLGPENWNGEAVSGVAPTSHRRAAMTM